MSVIWRKEQLNLAFFGEETHYEDISLTVRGVHLTFYNKTRADV